MLRLYILYSSSDVKLRCLYNPRILRLGEFEKSWASVSDMEKDYCKRKDMEKTSWKERKICI